MTPVTPAVLGAGLPQLDIWHNKDQRRWWEPIHRERIPFVAENPLSLQVQQFCRVIRGLEPPLVSGREGLETLKVTEAVKASAATGKAVELNIVPKPTQGARS
jgi:predicted dehydrogenase